MKTLFTLIFLSTISMLYSQNSNLTISKNGQGEDQIILISGLACKNEIWNQTIDSLSKNATIYAIDYYEDKNSELTTIEQVTNQIIDWTINQKIKDPTIIGHSLGGAIALNVAFKIPNNIANLIILDAYPSIVALSNLDFKVNPKNDCSAFVKQFTSMTEEQFKNIQSTNLTQMTIKPLERQKLLDWLIHCDRVNYALLLCDYLNTDIRENIRSINCPTLILASKSMKSFEKNIDYQYKNLEQYKIIYSKNGLHFLMFDDYSWYINKIKMFID